MLTFFVNMVFYKVTALTKRPKRDNSAIRVSSGWLKTFGEFMEESVLVATDLIRNTLQLLAYQLFAVDGPGEEPSCPVICPNQSANCPILANQNGRGSLMRELDNILLVVEMLESEARIHRKNKDGKNRAA